jgi:hypothetical protein
VSSWSVQSATPPAVLPMPVRLALLLYRSNVQVRCMQRELSELLQIMAHLDR